MERLLDLSLLGFRLSLGLGLGIQPYGIEHRVADLALGAEYVVRFLLAFGFIGVVPDFRIPQEIVSHLGHTLDSYVGRGAHLISLTYDYDFHVLLYKHRSPSPHTQGKGFWCGGWVVANYCANDNPGT